MDRLRNVRLTARSSVKCQYESLSKLFPGDECVNVVGNDLRRLVEFGFESVLVGFDQTSADDSKTQGSQNANFCFRKSVAHSC